MTNYQLPNGNPENLEIHHAYKFDKHADLPLKIYNHDKSKIAIIPTDKKRMILAIPKYFKVFDEKSLFRESKHQAGEIYEIQIPFLDDPENVADIIKMVLENRFDMGIFSSCDYRQTSRDSNTYVNTRSKSPPQLWEDFENNSTHDKFLDYFYISNYFGIDIIITELIAAACDLPKVDFGLLALCAYHNKLNKEDKKMIRRTIRERRIQDQDKFLSKLWSYINITDSDLSAKREFVEKYGSLFNLSYQKDEIKFDSLIRPKSKNNLDKITDSEWLDSEFYSHLPRKWNTKDTNFYRRSWRDWIPQPTIDWEVHSDDTISVASTKTQNIDKQVACVSDGYFSLLSPFYWEVEFVDLEVLVWPKPLIVVGFISISDDAQRNDDLSFNDPPIVFRLDLDAGHWTLFSKYLISSSANERINQYVRINEYQGKLPKYSSDKLKVIGCGYDNNQCWLTFNGVNIMSQEIEFKDDPFDYKLRPIFFMKKFKSLKIRGNFGQRDYVYNLKDHVRMNVYYLSSYWKNFESSSDDETED